MIEHIIFANLIHDDEYARKVLPFLKKEYFHSRVDQNLFSMIRKFIDRYNKLPSVSALLVEVDNNSGLNEDEYKGLFSKIEQLTKTDVDPSWLIDQTEKFCQDKAIYNAIYQSIGIIDDKGNANSKEDKGSIPKILSDALSVSFDAHIGHDLFDDIDQRYEFYHRKESRIPFDLEYFNRITKGGLPNKTLNIILAGTNVGKSLFMCHCAASNVARGSNVLYITMEMAEERIAERIDANLLNVSMDEINNLSKEVYEKKMARVKSMTPGKLIIKEYPTASAGSAHFRHLLNELRLKRNFKPDIIYIDYLNICSSSRLKYGSTVNSYTYVKSIAEELRGLAVEFGVPIVSATQTTRSGFTNSDPGIEDTSESFGLPATADLMFALISTDELQEMNQIMVKQLKNRYGDPSSNKRFVIGVDRAKMKLYDVEQHAQEDIVDDVPVFDNTESGKRIKSERRTNKKNFEGFC